MAENDQQRFQSVGTVDFQPRHRRQKMNRVVKVYRVLNVHNKLYAGRTTAREVDGRLVFKMNGFDFGEYIFYVMPEGDEGGVDSKPSLWSRLRGIFQNRLP